MRRMGFIAVALLLSIGAIAVAQSKTATGNIYTLTPEIDNSGRGGSIHLVTDRNLQTEIMFGVNKRKIAFKMIGDSLNVDMNGDGRFDAKDGAPITNGKTFSLPVEIAGKKLEYPLMAAFYESSVSLSGALILKTDVDGVPYRLIDSNVNGVFGEMGVDHLRIGNTSPIPIEKTMIANGKLRHLEVLDDGKSLRITPYTGTLAKLKITTMDKWGISLSINGVSNKFHTHLTGGKTTPLPPGKYKVEYTYIRTPVGNANSKPTPPDAYLYGKEDAEAPELTIDAGENSIKFGAPFSLTFSAKRPSKDGIIISTASLIGIAGEHYYVSIRENGKKKKAGIWVRTGKTEKFLGNIEYG